MNFLQDNSFQVDCSIAIGYLAVYRYAAHHYRMLLLSPLNLALSVADRYVGERKYIKYYNKLNYSERKVANQLI